MDSAYLVLDRGMTDFNTAIIDEFRTNEGRVGGMFEGRPLLLLTTTGARTGQPRTSPLAYFREGERLYVFASKGGADEDPLWFGNLLADPKVTVEVGTERFTGTATPLEGAERDRVWRAQVAAMPNFGDYEKKTTRVIPVIALDRDPA
jgi:deazaflavin-dependent oxidoreductase (nitroreductase family)